MDLAWNSVTRAATLHTEEAQLRHRLADAAKAADWPQVLAILEQRPDLSNSTRPDGHAWYAPLHQAAYTGAPLAVVERLLALGAWRSLPTAAGELASTIARRQGQGPLLEVLEPVYQHDLPHDAVAAIQSQLHLVIRERAARLVNAHALRLPELLPLLELAVPQLWAPIPGIYGGFSLRFDLHAPEPLLVTESWCRVVGGSGQRHEITAQGSRLVDEGFV
ncbi:MAG TPA: hypothetical protein VGE07_23280 [Herpetosiphonaceae bacterium]